MVDKVPNPDDLLLPDHHPQADLFVCDVADAVVKDDMATMEHPFYSLSTRPDTRVRRYENGAHWLEVTPSVKGLATIHDKDILIYCISQVIAKVRQGEPTGRTLKITASDLLIFTNRKLGGRQYELLLEALERLKGTMITTNIETGDEIFEDTSGFGLIDDFNIKRSRTTGRITEVTVTLSEWTFKSIRKRQVLTLHKNYFRLRKPIERRVYEIARKHCGQQDQWKINLDLLKKKCGSRASMKEFRRSIRELADGDHLPDYAVIFDKQDCVTFYNRHTMPAQLAEKVEYPRLDSETYNDAKTVAPGYDVYYLEQEWRDFWVNSGKPDFKNPDAAFIGFCKARAARRPLS